MFNSLNKGIHTLKEDVKLETMEFKPLKEFVGKVIKVDGFFFTNGRYGKQVVLVGGGYKINMPARARETFELIASNEEMLNAVLSGHLAITDIKIIDTKNGQTTAYTLADC